MNANEEFASCPICGTDLERVDCPVCMGEGEFDLHEDDPLLFAPGEIDPCTWCDGEGSYLECPNLPHTQGATK